MPVIAIHPELNQLLAAHRVQIFQPREHMVQLNAVPTGVGFSKPCTNVLLRQQLEGGPWEVFVDDDLAYAGDNSERTGLFRGTRRQHWLRLNPTEALLGDINEAVLHVLGWLDSPMSNLVPPALRQPAPATVPHRSLVSLLERVGRVLGPEELGLTEVEPTAAQLDTIARTAGTLTRSTMPACPLLLGPAGAGKTAVARLTARELVQRKVVRHVAEVKGASLCCGAIFWPQRDERFRQLLDALLTYQDTLLILEQFDLLLTRSEVGTALITDGLDRGLKLLAVGRPKLSSEAINPESPLARRLEFVPVVEPEPEEMDQILRRWLQQHRLAQQVEITPEAVAAVRVLAQRRPGANPGAALGLLEAVLAHAAWAGQKCAGPDDVYHLVTEQET